MLTQGGNQLPKLKEASRIADLYMVTSNRSWGKMSVMTLAARQRNHIIAHDLCCTVVCKGWAKGVRDKKASDYSVSILMNYRYTLCLRKKQDTKLLPITSPNVNRFSKFFHWLIHW